MHFTHPRPPASETGDQPECPIHTSPISSAPSLSHPNSFPHLSNPNFVSQPPYASRHTNEKFDWSARHTHARLIFFPPQIRPRGNSFFFFLAHNSFFCVSSAPRVDENHTTSPRKIHNDEPPNFLVVNRSIGSEHNLSLQQLRPLNQLVSTVVRSVFSRAFFFLPTSHREIWTLN